MDNHESHVCLEVIIYAKENGIILLTIPSHTSHKLQPLDRTVYGPLKTFYNKACDDWMVSHPGRTMTIYEIAECFGHSFPFAFTPRNIESGFRATGIWPVNSDIFTDEDYLSAYVTDRVIEDIAEETVTETKIPLEQHEQKPEEIEKAFPSTSENNISWEPRQENSLQGLAQHFNENSIQSIFQADFNQISTSATTLTTPEMIRPHPKAAPRKMNFRRGRKRAHIRVLTDTPEKKAIELEFMKTEQKKKEKERKVKIKEAKLSFKTKKILTKKSSSSEDDVLLFSDSKYDVRGNIETGDTTECKSENNEELKLSDGNWVIVNFVSEKKKIHRYVGQIEKKTVGGFIVKFATKKDDKTFKWPEKEDIDEVEWSQIVKKLPELKFKSSSKRVGCFIFPKSLQNFKVE